MNQLNNNKFTPLQPNKSITDIINGMDSLYTSKRKEKKTASHPGGLQKEEDKKEKEKEASQKLFNSLNIFGDGRGRDIKSDIFNKIPQLIKDAGETIYTYEHDYQNLIEMLIQDGRDSALKALDLILDYVDVNKFKRSSKWIGDDGGPRFPPVEQATYLLCDWGYQVLKVLLKHKVYISGWSLIMLLRTAAERSSTDFEEFEFDNSSRKTQVKMFSRILNHGANPYQKYKLKNGKEICAYDVAKELKHTLILQLIKKSYRQQQISKTINSLGNRLNGDIVSHIHREFKC